MLRLLPPFLVILGSYKIIYGSSAIKIKFFKSKIYFNKHTYHIFIWKIPTSREIPSVLFYIIYKFYEATCTSVLQFQYFVTSFESIFNPEQGYTKVTALKFVLVATGL